MALDNTQLDVWHFIESYIATMWAKETQTSVGTGLQMRVKEFRNKNVRGLSAVAPAAARCATLSAPEPRSHSLKNVNCLRGKSEKMAS